MSVSNAAQRDLSEGDGQGPSNVDPGARGCVVCGATDPKPLHGPGSDVVRCSCGLVYISPLPTPEEVQRREDDAFDGGLRDETSEMFAAYYRDFPEDPVVIGFRDMLKQLHGMTGGGRLYDVGIGTGLLLHLAREAGFDARGVEISAGAAEKANEEFGVEVTVGDFESVDLSEPADAITMADVLEHTRDPRRFLERAVEVLKPGGSLFVAVPCHRSTLFWAADIMTRIPFLSEQAKRLYVPNHYYYFTPATLTRLVQEVGLEVKVCRGETPYLGRYNFSPIVKAGLATLLTLGRLTGLEARCEIYATKPESSGG